MSKRVVGGILAVIVIVAGVAAVFMLGGKDTPSNANNATPSNTTKTNNTEPTKQAEATNSITIKDYSYSPATITVKVGTKVTWTNQDAVGHTVTADSGTGPDSQLIDQGQSYSFTFDKAGTYTYHCTPHPYMKGTVVVTE
jgi:amicyanin